MLGQQFYHETMRKVVVSFGTIFNNINIVRKNNSGAIIQKMKVPLAYGPAQKFLTRLDNDPSLKNKVAVTLPRIGFEIANLAYDPVRKLNRVQKFKKVKDAAKIGARGLLGGAASGDILVIRINQITRTNFRGEKISMNYKGVITVRVK